MKRLLLAALVACSSSSSANEVPGTTKPCLVTRALTSVGDVGGLGMYVHVPGGTVTDIVVALHGCTQHASDYEKAGWNPIADANGFVVIYPEQSTGNNPSRCFRWWEPTQNARDMGEAKAIVDMVAKARTDYGANGKVFVTGLSAGGAMAAQLLAAYPDLFEAGAIMSGVTAGCATNQTDALNCSAGNVTRTAAQWKALVPTTATPPRVSIWQGTNDSVVDPRNEAELIKQWTAVNGVAVEPSSTEIIGKATHAVYNDRVESWTIQGMSHGVAVDALGGCGSAGSYALDVGLCSSGRAATFFGFGKAPPPEDAGTSSSSSTSSTSSSSSSSSGSGTNCP